jgi:hypothetical protein
MKINAIHTMVGKQILQREECYVVPGKGCGHRVENFIPIYGICKILLVNNSFLLYSRQEKKKGGDADGNPHSLFHRDLLASSNGKARV